MRTVLPSLLLSPPRGSLHISVQAARALTVNISQLNVSFIFVSFFPFCSLLYTMLSYGTLHVLALKLLYGQIVLFF